MLAAGGCLLVLCFFAPFGWWLGSCVIAMQLNFICCFEPYVAFSTCVSLVGFNIDSDVTHSWPFSFKVSVINMFFAQNGLRNLKHVGQVQSIWALFRIGHVFPKDTWGAYYASLAAVSLIVAGRKVSKIWLCIDEILSSGFIP